MTAPAAKLKSSFLFRLSDGARTLAHLLHDRLASSVKARSSFKQDNSWLWLGHFPKNTGSIPLKLNNKMYHFLSACSDRGFITQKLNSTIVTMMILN